MINKINHYQPYSSPLECSSSATHLISLGFLSSATYLLFYEVPSSLIDDSSCIMTWAYLSGGGEVSQVQTPIESVPVLKG